MSKIFTSAQMREIDNNCSAIYGIDSLILMENAAMRVIEEIEKDFPKLKGKEIACFCGKGNNGGDGFAIARHLIRLGASVTVFLTGGRSFSPDAQKNFSILESIGCEITEDFSNLELMLYKYDILVDAIFGTGIYGTVSDQVYSIIEAINNNSRYIISVDVPSGINADTGEICGICINATKTVTFVGFKPANFLFPASDFFGETVVGSICTPNELLESCVGHCIDTALVLEHYPKRFNNSQKGDYGKVLIIGGSTGMSGAVILSARGALTTGAGLVYVASTTDVCTMVDCAVSEAITYRLPSVNGHLSKSSIESINKLIEKPDAILFGPGIGQSEDILEILEVVMSKCTVPLIIDADGLNALSKKPELIESCNCNLIFTPHEVEMSRLLKCSLSEVTNNRLELSSAYAQDNGVTLILKGHHTIVTASDGLQYINITGNPGMATGGSGDVLAGMALSLAARGISEEIAAAMAVFLHGSAGDMAEEDLGPDSITAGDIVNYIPKAVNQTLKYN